LRLVFLYGPPASGKLTVARELAKLTGYKVFHNHLTVDMADEVFEFGSRPWTEVVGRTRVLVAEVAAKASIPGLIYTFVYGHPMDVPHVKKLTLTVERHGGKVCFVQLVCDHETLMRRVGNRSRTEFRKLKSRAKLRRLLSLWDLSIPVPGVRSLRIDTSKSGAAAAARRIKRHYRL
jgi:chloramphenicol 3-O-phosphotransferase